MNRIALVLFGSAVMLFLAGVGAIGGAIVGLLLLVLAAPLWVRHVAAWPGSEDTLVAVALGCGGLCGAAIVLALIANVAFSGDPA